MGAIRVSVAALVVGLVAGCGVGRTDDTDYSGAIVVGTTDKVFSLDPARSYDNGSSTVHWNVYPLLLNFRPGVTAQQPDVARSCGFTEPTAYTCALRPGLRFANGNPLTARSVKHSFDRVVAINDPNGPSSLLGNLAKTEAPDDLTVVFTLKVPNDQTFPMILSTPAAPIVDERVFPANRVLDDDAVVAAKPFAGPYVIAGYAKNRLIEYRANPDYEGALGKPKTAIVVSKTYVSSENMKLDLQNNAVDVGYRSFSPQDIGTLRASRRVRVHEGPGGELRYVVFNLTTMPGADLASKTAIRKAFASSVDRAALAKDVYLGTYEPSYSQVPPGLPGATDSFRRVYGAGPNRAEAARFLAEAGVQTPVTLNIQYNPDHYGASSSEEYAAVKSQVESTGLFRVNLQATEWVAYQAERVKDSYPVYQFGWFPDFPDADNYLTPFNGPNNFLQSHFASPEIDEMLLREAGEPDWSKREAIMHEVQDTLTRDYLPVVPLLSGKQIAVAGNDIDGVEATLDASFRFRFTVLSKTS